MPLNNLLKNFHEAILQNSPHPVIADIKNNGRITAAEQLEIYISGYRVRLTQAVHDDYPALHSLLGENDFNKLALAYIEAMPPSGFNLDIYPHKFASFITGKVDGFAAGLALLEGAIAEVFMMPESRPFSANAMQGISPTEITLKPREASKLISFKYNVNEWLNMVRAGKIPEKFPPTDSFLYIYRHQNNIQRAVLSHPEYILLSQIFGGGTLEFALENSVTLYPQYQEIIESNIEEWFEKWTVGGFFSY